MKKLAAFIVGGCLLLAGCQIPSSSSERHYDQVSREIEQLKSTTDIGDNIKIVVNLLTVSAEDMVAIDTLWRYTDKNITIANRPDAVPDTSVSVGKFPCRDFSIWGDGIPESLMNFARPGDHWKWRLESFLPA